MHWSRQNVFKNKLKLKLTIHLTKYNKFWDLSLKFIKIKYYIRAKSKLKRRNQIRIAGIIDILSWC